MAFQYWRQRPRPAAGEDLLRGPGRGLPRRHAGGVSVGGVERFHACSARCCSRRSALPAPDTYRTAAGRAAKIACWSIRWPQLERLLAEHHARIAALVIEPLVQAAAGMIVHPPRLSPRRARTDAKVRRAADRRRSGRRLRPHRPDVRLRARRGDARPALHRQGPDRRLPAAGRHAGDRRDLAGVSGRLRRRAGPSITATPTAATRWAAAAALATLDVFEEERTLEHLPEKIARLGEHLAPLARHAARRRRPPVRADRRHRAGPRSGHARSRIPRRSGSAAASARWPCGTASSCVPWAT